MDYDDTIFKGKNVSFEQILHGQALGGPMAVARYLSYRRDGLVSKLASVDTEDEARMIACANAVTTAYEMLKYLVDKDQIKFRSF